jgi:hypothetical protein
VLGHISLNGCLWLDTLVGTKERYSTSRRCTVFPLSRQSCHLSLSGCLWLDTLVGTKEGYSTIRLCTVFLLGRQSCRVACLLMGLSGKTHWLEPKRDTAQVILYSNSAGQAVVPGHISLNGCLWLDTLVGTNNRYSTSRRCTVFPVLNVGCFM